MSGLRYNMQVEDNNQQGKYKLKLCNIKKNFKQGGINHILREEHFLINCRSYCIRGPN